MAVPTDSGFWTTSFAATISPIDSSIEFPAVASADADLCSASPMPAELIAKLLPRVCYTTIAYIIASYDRRLVISASLCNFIVRLYLQSRLYLHLREKGMA